MIKLNVHEAKTHLSYYLQKLKRGETILLCRRNVPIAEIRPLPSRRKTKRQIGLAKGKFEVDPRFFEPLPAEIVDSFYGGGSGDCLWTRPLFCGSSATRLSFPTVPGS